MKRNLAIASLLTAAVALPLAALAQTSGPDVAGGTTVLPNPLGDAVTPTELAGRVIKTVIGLSGVAALIVFIYGGLTFMFSGGNSQKVESAKQTIVYATLGLAVIFAGYSVLAFVLKFLGGATGN